MICLSRFKGYHGNLYWATLESDRVPFTVYSETDGLYFRVFTPEEPKHRRNGEDTMKEFQQVISLSCMIFRPCVLLKPSQNMGHIANPALFALSREMMVCA